MEDKHTANEDKCLRGPPPLKQHSSHTMYLLNPSESEHFNLVMPPQCFALHYVRMHGPLLDWVQSTLDYPDFFSSPNFVMNIH